MTDAQETAADTSLRTTGGAPPDDVAPAPIPLLEPREGIPPVVASDDALARVVAAFAAGTGPVAVDAERASGYRYGQRAYLVQLRREPPIPSGSMSLVVLEDGPHGPHCPLVHLADVVQDEVEVAVGVNVRRRRLGSQPRDPAVKDVDVAPGSPPERLHDAGQRPG